MHARALNVACSSVLLFLFGVLSLVACSSVLLFLFGVLSLVACCTTIRRSVGLDQDLDLSERGFEEF